jgi:hypothetical protein
MKSDFYNEVPGSWVLHLCTSEAVEGNVDQMSTPFTQAALISALAYPTT